MTLFFKIKKKIYIKKIYNIIIKSKNFPSKLLSNFKFQNF